MENLRWPWRVLCALLVAGVATACEREAPALRRPWEGATDLRPVTIDGTTMAARRLPAEPRVQTFSLGRAGTGDAWVYAAVEGGTGAHATIEVDGASPPTACDVAATPARWYPCRFALTRRFDDLLLRARIEGPADARLVVAAPLLRSGSPSTRLAVVILMDTARRDRFTTYERTIPLGTALDRVAGDGVVFDRAYSSSSWTRTAVTTLLTGLDASTHGVLGRDDTLPAELDGLPQALQRAGYRTIAWSSNPNILPIWGFAHGFDAFHDLGALAWPKEKVPAATMLAAAGTALAEPLPAFLYVHLMDPHAPYRPEPADLQAVATDAALMATFPSDQRTPIMLDEYARYLAEIRGMDRALGGFFDDLRTRGLYDDAAILVLADHGEEFLDHGGTRHGKTLYEEMLRVPVVLKLPGNALAGTRIASAVGLADLGPTLLAALGVAGLAGVDGRNLWDRDHHRLRDEPAAQSAVLKLDTHHKAALIADDRKLILDYFATDQLFDLAADPLERRNLLPGAAAVATELRSALDARIARHESGWHVRVCGGDRDERQRLQIRVRSEMHGALLETGDVVRLVAHRDGFDEYEADLGLTPGPSERLVNGRLWKGLRPDEDDLVAGSAAAPSLMVSSADGTPLAVALGMAAAQQDATELTADAADPAVRVRPSTPIDCRPQAWNDEVPPEGRRSYVRIWYVPPSERLHDGEVDGALQERLRALGYQR